MSSKDANEVSTESDSDDKTTHVPGSMVESSKKKDLKKFYFVTKDGEHVHLTKEQVSAQKNIEEEAKAEATRREANKRLKSSAQYEDHPAGIVLNEPVLGNAKLTKPQVFYDDIHNKLLVTNTSILKELSGFTPIIYEAVILLRNKNVISELKKKRHELGKESRSKMLDKQNYPISIKQKINISPIDYSKLNKIKEDYGKRIVTKKELSAEQAFWLKHSNHTFDISVKSHTLVRIEAPSELPKVSWVNESLKKLKYHLASFDKVVKKRTTSDAITAEQSLKSIDERPFQMGTFWETLAEGNEGSLHLGQNNSDSNLTYHLKISGVAKADIRKATNLLLSRFGIQKKTVNSQLYDDFEHSIEQRETTNNELYVWFVQTHHAMLTSRKQCHRMQLNSKFVNNMLPEWGRFVTAVKLNRD
ncbi:hypothetical protein Tco_0024818 [Tanacetum coccineum]